jgi:hypothetical protein
VSKHAIAQPAEFVGEWFLPDQEAAPRVTGTLTWSEKGATAKLHQPLTPLRGAVYGGDGRSYPAIHGTTIDSKLVSVLDATGGGAGFTLGPAGIRETETIVSSWVVVGGHVGLDTNFSEMTARIPGLQLWIGRTGVTQTILDKTETSGPGVVYYIEGLPEEETSVPTLRTKLGWGISRSFSGDLVSEISVTTSASLRIQPDEPHNLQWFVEQLGKATTLLSLLAGSSMSPDHLSAREATAGFNVEVLVSLRQAEYCTFTKAREFYILRNAMEVDLGAIVSKWFEIYDSIAMPSQLALSVLNTRDLWLHVEFLSLMQALEGFHRAVMDGKYSPDEDYEAVKLALSSAIPASVAADHRAALKARIKYGNEISLRKRLDGLAQRIPLEIRRLILGADGDAPSSWVATRNYYTHWDEASRGAVLDGIGMHRAGVRMRHLLRVLYLSLVGIPDAAIAKALHAASDECQYLAQLNSMEHRQSNPGSEAGALLRIDSQAPRASDSSS